MTDFSPAFLGMFESLRMGPTFARGRRDERAGHVRSLTVSGSLVVAMVRGPDDPAAFRARIAVRAFGASEWARAETALVVEARYLADLLDGRMPRGIESIFTDAGLSLLPLSLDEVAMDCTCERWPMPCAHLAATCYALARAFEGDPFEVFTWRGRPRDELLMRLRRLREAAAVDGESAPGSSPRASEPVSSDEGASRAHQASDPVAFWGAAPRAGTDPGEQGRAGTRDGRSGSVRQHAQATETDAALGDSADAALGDSADARLRDSEAGVLRPDALLDQLDEPGLSHQGRSIVDVLRAAYRALPTEEDFGPTGR